MTRNLIDCFIPWKIKQRSQYFTIWRTCKIIKKCLFDIYEFFGFKKIDQILFVLRFFIIYWIKSNWVNYEDCKKNYRINNNIKFFIDDPPSSPWGRFKVGPWWRAYPFEARIPRRRLKRKIKFAIASKCTQVTPWNPHFSEKKSSVGTLEDPICITPGQLWTVPSGRGQLVPITFEMYLFHTFHCQQDLLLQWPGGLRQRRRWRSQRRRGPRPSGR